MENYCINCGRDLRNAPYTAPWEDGDNEEGYWTCPSCHTKNIDWASADDDDSPSLWISRAKNKNRQRTAFSFRNTLAVPFYSNASRFCFHAT